MIVANTNLGNNLLIKISLEESIKRIFALTLKNQLSAYMLIKNKYKKIVSRILLFFLNAIASNKKCN